ncbi:hypothetical protein PhCBS80983_g01824 [Powellomyces hirtus]|uniref:Uncharacterized protein n=1 Tax=Powellomyces hirtus TaxID=109895 RepID=A0A507EAP6_9FUNG|nr:hypothetical protein PhCBS80983_g01824 [Powellomyces hirtus]
MSQVPKLPIRVAILGAGIFAKKSHLPTILGHPSLFKLTGVYSRSKKSAQDTCDAVPSSYGPVQVYSDDSGAGSTLNDLLARDDLDAVVMCLPVGVQERIVKLAVENGKHVLSEKPVSGSGKEADKLMSWYAAAVTRGSGVTWLVAENWRAEAATLYAADLVRGVGKGVRTFSMQCWLETRPDNAYVATGWRVGAGSVLPGGFLLDGGVHWLAMLRAVVGDVRTAAAFSSLCLPYCAPVDTVSGILALEKSPAAGTVNICFAASGRPFDIVLTVICVAGTVAIRVGTGGDPKGARRFEVEWTPEGGEGGNKREFPFAGIDAEFQEFARSVAGVDALPGVTKSDFASPDLSPAQAAKDVRTVEALLKSADQNGVPVNV